MNTESTAIVALILILMLGFFAFVYMGKSTTPTTTAPTDSDRPSAFDNRNIDDLIVITSPKPNQEISSPLKIEGRARGFWFFEADFPVTLVNNDGQTIAQGIATAKSDWMTENFVPFSAELKFSPSPGTTGFLILRNSNPSDIEEHNRQTQVPVIFKGPEMMTVKVFFCNSNRTEDFMGLQIMAAERTIPKTTSTAKAALEELLKGPTWAEAAEGYYTNINSGVKIQSLSVVNGVARVDFDERLDYQVAGSARVGAIREQIIQTLKQFPTVKDVIISIDGRTEDILQP